MTVTAVTKLSPPPPSQDPYAFAQWLYQAYTILINTLQLTGLTVPITLVNGGTGGTTLAQAQANLGIPSFASPLPVTSGGTGASSLTANNVLLGNGSTVPQFVAPGTTGNLLTSDGTTWQSAIPGRFMVSFDGTTASPCTIYRSNNVTSVTKNATGQYTINITSALPDNNTIVLAAGQRDSDNTDIAHIWGNASAGTSITTTAIKIENRNDANALVDGKVICVMGF